MATGVNKHISKQVQAYAEKLEQETACRLVFKQFVRSIGQQAAEILLSDDPRVAEVSFDPNRLGSDGITPMLIHEISHGFQYFRDGFYKFRYLSAIPDRDVTVGSDCQTVVLDIDADMRVKSAGFQAWTSTELKGIRQTIESMRVVDAKKVLSVVDSWTIVFEILNRRLALEYMTIDDDMVGLFQEYLQACWDCLPKQISYDVTKLVKVIRRHNVFEPNGSRAAIEALMGVYGIRNWFQFKKAA
jgi:hypothetical protein